MMAKKSEVGKRIEGARRNGLTELDLSGALTTVELTEVPDEVFELQRLESVNLRGNRIRVVPERFHELPNLRRLDISRNPIERVPNLPGLTLDWESYFRCRAGLSPGNISGIDLRTDTPLLGADQLLPDVSSLVELSCLTIGPLWIEAYEPFRTPAAAVHKLIENISRFTKLVTLTIWGIRLGEFPPGIRALKRLKRLSLAHTDICSIPTWLSELQNLAILKLRSCQLKSLPDSLAYLTQLHAVDLSGNGLRQIPGVLFRIKTLRSLELAWSAGFGPPGPVLRVIPAKILDLPSLDLLNVSGQNIQTPPPEVVKQGLEGIRDYWRQRQKVGVDYLCEAKLIVVGEAGAGKTSLARKIVDPAYSLRAQETSTEGIEVSHWSFAAVVRVKRDEVEELLQRAFQVNIWDFGGQEIYHSTHQFFLTRRSLYLLVADDRKEDTDFNYWLSVVELLSDGSPILLVRNEKQDRQRDLDLATLRQRFPSLRTAYRTNLESNRGLEELTSAVRRELERLPHIGAPLPATWSRVRAALEKDARDYVGLDAFLDICQNHGFTRVEDKLQLSSYLHDLGICLHFQDDPVLKHVVILKPKWGTDAVYRVLDDPAVLDLRGRFGRADLARIWAEPTYSPMRDELLRLMMKFQLCYQVPGRDEFIAPQLLSPTRPEYAWSTTGSLVLRYEYDFMPKGLITRLIVALHHLIADPKLVWKGGVVVQRQGTRGEVVEDYARRKITVRLAGPDARGLLAIVDDHLERIHASMPRLKYEKYLPCNCSGCQGRGEPCAFPLTELIDFARDAAPIQCRVSRKLVNAAELLQDLFPTALRSRVMRAGWEMRESQQEPDGEPSAVAEPREVYVSYARKPESAAVADQLEAACQERDIRLLRDQNEIRYKDSIRAFMQRIGRGKCIVTILSPSYFQSVSCMFELTEIAARGDLRARVFPILTADAAITEPLERVKHIQHWEQKKEQLDAAMKGVSGADLQGIREELDLYTKIRSTLASLVEVLADMKAISLKPGAEIDIGELMKALEQRLSE
ncbi:MAG: leucine-rich repeat domain-containing protein [Planctomycetes bacterium]|nr:leucine-rich repeat domain-containing protein [Planctomycetota bacterium]